MSVWILPSSAFAPGRAFYRDPTVTLTRHCYVDIVGCQPRLHPGVLVRYSHCRRPHPAIKPYTEGTPHTLALLFVVCGLRYYVGQEGGKSRHEIGGRTTES